MSLPNSNNMSLWADTENPSIIFHRLPEINDLLLGWPDAVGANITDKVQFDALGDIELVSATRGVETYKIHFVQNDANAYVIFNGISEE